MIESGSVSRKAFREELMRLKRGSVTRRQFMGVTGLGAAVALLGGAMAALRPGRAHADGLDRLFVLATPGGRHGPQNLDAFRDASGELIMARTFRSHAEMFEKVEGDGIRWDVFLPGNASIEALVAQDLLSPLDLSSLPNYAPDNINPVFAQAGVVAGRVYAVPKAWGTTGIAVNTRYDGGRPLTGWKDFFDRTMDDFSGQAVMFDEQVASIGAALRYHGHSFNALDEAALAQAETLLMEVKPHLAFLSPGILLPLRMRRARLSMAFSGDARLLLRDIPDHAFVMPVEGTELWCDCYAISRQGRRDEAAHALIDFMLSPAMGAAEARATGYAPADERARARLPSGMLNDPVVYPDDDVLSTLEIVAAETLTNARRHDIFARFRAA